MRLFVLDQDGNRYGPVDIPTLNQWVRDGRVIETTSILVEGTGKVIPAGQVPGINLSMAPGAGLGGIRPGAGAQRQPGPNDPPMGFPSSTAMGGGYSSGPFGGGGVPTTASRDLNVSFALSGTSLLVCFCGGSILSLFMCAGAYYFAKRAHAAGSTGTNLAYWCAFGGFGLAVLGVMMNAMAAQFLSEVFHR